MRRYIFLVMLALVAAACEPTPVAEFTDRPVVCCYLKAGETPTLTVQKLIPFQSDAQFSAENVDNLTIVITDATEGREYPLNGAGNGTYSNPELVVESGHSYELAFQYDGEPVTATTIVPSAPVGVTFSGNSIGVMSFSRPDETAMNASKAPNEGIEISWENAEGDYYIVEGTTESVSLVRELEEDEDMPSQSFKLDYTQGESATLSSANFNYYGKYAVSVMHIRPEYAVMSQGGATASASLVDVRGNVDGGYGIFTGVNSVTDTVTVRVQTSPF